jgi:nucleoside-diphosphate-sugar epimerase
LVAEILGIPEPQIEYGDWTPGDIKVFEIDNTKIRTQLGLEFLTDFRAGLEQTVVWAKNYFQKMPGFNRRR